MSKNQGFTLIELIIAIVILGVIAVIAAPRFINISKDAKANTMLSVAAGMESALTLLHSQALIEGQDIGKGEITINGVKTPLLNGYPSVNGKDSFEEINAQVQAWFNIDSVGKNVIEIDSSAAPFFIDKASSRNQIYIFFSDAPTTGDRTEYGCQVRYQNPESEGPSVRVLTDDC
ncbi:TPA: type II secretion system protein [Vibrio cholerae]|uniref:Type IV pilin, putative n=10 Tax=Vibrio cholerae TaxID=666 RepID=Q9KUL6_VIBCH|nr:type II secretion system protein [Vibrio cholerae]EGQ9977514.1 type II secretion system protein [Vibrio parahaemolyticus]MBY8142086.1 type II secretion system GspH family protein [Vibrio fluvialis]AAF93672.1 type IV pilin, putative [Vibrio cholerae O1 biovar El Tor str. N16961]AFC57356.1 type IV pilin [Vibrio cholerae IEC224]AIC64145.1 fimbrial protein pilin [Vibrio cholerae]